MSGSPKENSSLCLAGPFLCPVVPRTIDGMISFAVDVDPSLRWSLSYQTLHITYQYSPRKLTYLNQYRYQASANLALRRHSNWLLTILILPFVAVAEGLPLCLNHLFTAGAIVPLILSTVLVTLFGQLIPLAIVPLYVLSVAFHMTWFISGLMWITSPLSMPQAGHSGGARSGASGNKIGELMVC